MKTLRGSPHVDPYPCPPCSYPERRVPGPLGAHGPSADKYIRYAAQTLFEHDLPVPELDRLTAIVDAALFAQSLLFATALRDLDQVELHQFFETFVLSCVMPASEMSCG